MKKNSHADTLAIILAAGEGYRMESKYSKVCTKIANKSIIQHVVENLNSAGIDNIIVVVGYQKDLVKQNLKDYRVNFVYQEEQLGTAHAVSQAQEYYVGHNGKTLIMYGDMPLISAETINLFINKSKKHSVSFVTSTMENPYGYGRVLRSNDENVVSIVEQRDATPAQESIKEVNTGVYLVKSSMLDSLLSKIDNNNAQEEYYLTDIVNSESLGVGIENCRDFFGINNKQQLYEASKIYYSRISDELMLKHGVFIVDKDSTYIDKTVKIGRDTTIYPNSFISGDTIIGEDSVIRSGCRIENSTIEDNVNILEGSIITDSFVGSNSNIGPYAHLRMNSKVSGKNRIGNFVEIKKSTLGEGSSAAHLTYLGDSEIGKNVNIGCGTITCNYDGFKKNKTIIGDNVFVGSDVQFIAPVIVEDGAMIAAGTTVTEQVAANSLAIARVKQKNIEGFATTFKNKRKKK